MMSENCLMLRECLFLVIGVQTTDVKIELTKDCLLSCLRSLIFFTFLTFLLHLFGFLFKIICYVYFDFLSNNNHTQLNGCNSSTLKAEFSTKDCYA